MILEIEKMVSVIISLYNIEKVKKIGTYVERERGQYGTPLLWLNSTTPAV